MTPKSSGPIISKTAGDTDSVTIEHPIGNGTWGIKWSKWSHYRITDDVSEVLIVTSVCLGVR